jgi:hypothetical protein
MNDLDVLHMVQIVLNFRYPIAPLKIGPVYVTFLTGNDLRYKIIKY